MVMLMFIGESGHRFRTSNQRNAKLFLAEQQRGLTPERLPRTWLGWVFLLVCLAFVLGLVLVGQI